MTMESNKNSEVRATIIMNNHYNKSNSDSTTRVTQISADKEFSYTSLWHVWA